MHDKWKILKVSFFLISFIFEIFEKEDKHEKCLVISSLQILCLSSFQILDQTRVNSLSNFFFISEVDQEDDTDSQPQREISVEWGGENIFDFRWWPKFD